MNQEMAVQLVELTRRFGDRVAVDGVSFDVPRGSIFGLLGPNGGGKTTLFRMLTTLLRPCGGKALVAGFDVTLDRQRVRRRIGVVFQSPSLDAKLSVKENLHHQGHLYALRGSMLAHRCDELLDRFGLSDRAADRVEILSGGLQRRVELAKSLLHRPEVLILDEPSTGLDPAARASVMAHLQGLRDLDGVSCLLTTHLMEEAEQCDHVAIMDRGRLVAFDTPGALKATIGGEVISLTARDCEGLARKVRERFAGPVEVVDGAVRLERSEAHSLIPALVEAFPGEIESAMVAKPTLGDVFLHLTGHRFAAEVEHN